MLDPNSIVLTIALPCSTVLKEELFTATVNHMWKNVPVLLLRNTVNVACLGAEMAVFGSRDMQWLIRTRCDKMCWRTGWNLSLGHNLKNVFPLFQHAPNFSCSHKLKAPKVQKDSSVRQSARPAVLWMPACFSSSTTVSFLRPGFATTSFMYFCPRSCCMCIADSFILVLNVFTQPPWPPTEASYPVWVWHIGCARPQLVDVWDGDKGLCFHQWLNFTSRQYYKKDVLVIRQLAD